MWKTEQRHAWSRQMFIGRSRGGKEGMGENPNPRGMPGDKGGARSGTGGRGLYMYVHVHAHVLALGLH